MSEKVVIEQDECIGCGVCVELCPSVFVLDDDAGVAQVIEDADAALECVDEAIASCPAECIRKEP